MNILVQNLFKEQRKKSKFINKIDILSILKGKYEEKAIEGAFKKLEDDGFMYQAYDDNYMLSEDNYH